MQLRGLADKRQVKGAKVALQHNLGLGGAAVVTMYKRPTWTDVPVCCNAALRNRAHSRSRAARLPRSLCRRGSALSRSACRLRTWLLKRPLLLLKPRPLKPRGATRSDNFKS